MGAYRGLERWDYGALSNISNHLYPPFRPWSVWGLSTVSPMPYPPFRPWSEWGHIEGWRAGSVYGHIEQHIQPPISPHTDHGLYGGWMCCSMPIVSTSLVLYMPPFRPWSIWGLSTVYKNFLYFTYSSLHTEECDDFLPLWDLYQYCFWPDLFTGKSRGSWPVIGYKECHTLRVWQW
jgi:hypothetical protein